jgi:peroxiredoxin Q/BCP
MTQQDVPYKAPKFSLITDEGQRVMLSDFRNQWLVLYFYPKDDTPGCTAEACSFRDERAALEQVNAQVVGVSLDSPSEHTAFKKKYALPFTLLSDPRAETVQRYGAWGKGMFGREGLRRMTFLIDPNGMVQKVYRRVTPQEHGKQVAQDLKRLQEK